MPRDRYTTAVRLQIEDILVREFGGTRLEFTARVSESPWALMHFMVRLPEEDSADTTSASAPVDVSEGNRLRIQGLLTEAARTWADRLVGAASTGAILRAEAEHYAAAFSEAYKQAMTPADAIADIGMISELTDDSVRLVFAERDEHGVAKLTWYLGGRPAPLSQLLPMLQSMGVVNRGATVHRHPARRAAGVDLPVQNPTAPDHRADVGAGAQRDSTAQRFADAVTAIWQGHVEIDRFNELVMRARLTWQQVVLLRAYAKYLRQAGFPYSQSNIESVLNEHPSTVRSLVTLFEALFDPRAFGSSTTRDAQAAAAAVAADIDALVSLDTDRILRAFASPVQATLRTNYFVTRKVGPRPQCAGAQAGRAADRRAAAAAPQVRDLRLFAPRRRRAPAVRPGGAWRPALVGPPGRFPHRDPRSGQGASGEERRHRAGRRQRRLRPQAAAVALR